MHPLFWQKGFHKDEPSLTHWVMCNIKQTKKFGNHAFSQWSSGSKCEKSIGDDRLYKNMVARARSQVLFA